MTTQTPQRARAGSNIPLSVEEINALVADVVRGVRGTPDVMAAVSNAFSITIDETCPEFSRYLEVRGPITTFPFFGATFPCQRYLLCLSSSYFDLIPSLYILFRSFRVFSFPKQTQIHSICATSCLIFHFDLCPCLLPCPALLFSFAPLFHLNLAFFFMFPRGVVEFLGLGSSALPFISTDNLKPAL